MSDVIQLNKVSVSGLKDAMRLSIATNTPLLVFGTYGNGKSDIARQVAADVSREMHLQILSTKDSIDLDGMVVLGDDADGFTRRQKPDLARGIEDGHILCVDEITSLAPSMQAAMYDVLLEGKMGSYQLPKSVVRWGMGNLTSDRSVVFELSRALTNRAIVVEYTGPTIDEYIEHGIRTLHPAVIGYLKQRPDALCPMDDTPLARARRPRSWTRLSGLLTEYESGEYTALPRVTLIASVIGDAGAADFDATVELAHQLVPLDVVHRDGAKAPLPEDEFTLRYMQTVSVGASVDKIEKFRSGMAYVSRMGDEYLAVFGLSMRGSPCWRDIMSDGKESAELLEKIGALMSRAEK